VLQWILIFLWLLQPEDESAIFRRNVRNESANRRASQLRMCECSTIWRHPALPCSRWHTTQSKHRRAYVTTNSVFTQTVSSSDDSASATLQQRTVHYEPDAIHVMALYGPKHVAACCVRRTISGLFVYNMLTRRRGGGGIQSKIKKFSNCFFLLEVFHDWEKTMLVGVHPFGEAAFSTTPKYKNK